MTLDTVATVPPSDQKVYALSEAVEFAKTFILFAAEPPKPPPSPVSEFSPVYGRMYLLLPCFCSCRRT
jgi:hypothetical protein